MEYAGIKGGNRVVGRTFSLITLFYTKKGVFDGPPANLKTWRVGGNNFCKNLVFPVVFS